MHGRGKLTARADQQLMLRQIGCFVSGEGSHILEGEPIDIGSKQIFFRCTVAYLSVAPVCDRS